jgi:xanthosine utilization system XapX-like protein
MMTNKWVQAGLTLGMSIGLFVGAFLSMAHPLAPIVCSVLVGLLSIWIGGNARGTDGWGGPYRGPMAEGK